MITWPISQWITEEKETVVPEIIQRIPTTNRCRNLVAISAAPSVRAATSIAVLGILVAVMLAR